MLQITPKQADNLTNAIISLTNQIQKGGAVNGGGASPKGVGGSNTMDGFFTMFTDKVGGMIKGITEVVTAPMVDRMAGATQRISTDSINDLINGAAKGIINPALLIGQIVEGGKNMAVKILKDIAELDDKILEETKASGAFVGQLGESMRDMLHESVADVQQLGVTIEKFLSATNDLMTNSGRMVLYSKETIDSGFQASAAFMKSNTELLENSENYRNVGLGLADAAKAVEKIGMKSISMGLNAKEVGSSLTTNIGKLNQYGFKDGIEGLGKMVQQAQSLKINIESTLNIADKLFDPTQAIDMAANLQVIGGAIGSFNDPLKMMYDATNDVGDLQNSLIGAAKSLATYNDEQGRFEVTGINLRKAKAMADALGMSMGDLTNMAVKGASKLETMSKLDMFPKLTDEQREFVSNLATMKDGKIGFDLPKDVAQKMGFKEGFLKMDDLNDNQLDKLVQIEEEIKNTKTEDIIRGQFNATTQIANTVMGIYLRMGGEARSSEEGRKIREASASFAKTMSDYDIKGKTLAQDGKKMYTDAVNEIKQKHPVIYDIGHNTKKGFKIATQGVENAWEKTQNFFQGKPKEKVDQTGENQYKKSTGKVENKEQNQQNTIEANVNLNVDVSNINSDLLASNLMKNPEFINTLSDHLTKNYKSFLNIGDT